MRPPFYAKRKLIKIPLRKYKLALLAPLSPVGCIPRHFWRAESDGSPEWGAPSYVPSVAAPLSVPGRLFPVFPTSAAFVFGFSARRYKLLSPANEGSFPPLVGGVWGGWPGPVFSTPANNPPAVIGVFGRLVPLFSCSGIFFTQLSAPCHF